MDVSELAMNVLEFRQRVFQFDRSVALGGEEYAVFVRTETESESRFRPKLVRLVVVLPVDWAVLDPASESLRIARDGRTVPPPLTEPVVEVGAEPAEFTEQGVRWKRRGAGDGTYLYVPADRPALEGPEAAAALAGPA